MKITMVKKGMTRYCQPEQLEQFRACGWAEQQLDLFNQKAQENIIKVEEQIVLKPPAKSKGAVKPSLDNANQQGDE